MKAADLASISFKILFILILTIGGVYNFSRHNLCSLLVEQTCNQVNILISSSGIPQSSSYLLDTQVLLMILVAALIILGIRSIVMKGKGGGSFVIISGILILPSILSFSFTPWSSWLSLLLGIPQELFSTEISFVECYLFTMLWAIGNISFRFISIFVKNKDDMKVRGLDQIDIDRIFSGSHSLLFLSMTGILLIFAGLLLPISYLNNLVYYLVEVMPLGVIILGVTFSLIILTSTYFLMKKLLNERHLQS